MSGHVVAGVAKAGESSHRFFSKKVNLKEKQK